MYAFNPLFCMSPQENASKLSDLKGVCKFNVLNIKSQFSHEAFSKGIYEILFLSAVDFKEMQILVSTCVIMHYIQNCAVIMCF